MCVELRKCNEDNQEITINKKRKMFVLDLYYQYILSKHLPILQIISIVSQYNPVLSLTWDLPVKTE